MKALYHCTDGDLRSETWVSSPVVKRIGEGTFKVLVKKEDLKKLIDDARQRQAEIALQVEADEKKARARRTNEIKSLSNQVLLAEYNRLLDAGMVSGDLRAELLSRGILADVATTNYEAVKASNLYAQARAQGWTEEYEDGYIPEWAKQPVSKQSPYSDYLREINND